MSVEDALNVLRHRLDWYKRRGAAGDEIGELLGCIAEIERRMPSRQTFRAAELRQRPLIANGALVLLDDAAVDRMVRDSDWDGTLRADLCCHVKALAADRELLVEHTQHLWGQIQAQRDEMSLMKAELDRREFGETSGLEYGDGDD